MKSAVLVLVMTWATCLASPYLYQQLRCLRYRVPAFAIGGSAHWFSIVEIAQAVVLLQLRFLQELGNSRFSGRV